MSTEGICQCTERSSYTTRLEIYILSILLSKGLKQEDPAPLSRALVISDLLPRAQANVLIQSNGF